MRRGDMRCEMPSQTAPTTWPIAKATKARTIVVTGSIPFSKHTVRAVRAVKAPINLDMQFLQGVQRITFSQWKYWVDCPGNLRVIRELLRQISEIFVKHPIGNFAFSH